MTLKFRRIDPYRVQVLVENDKGEFEERAIVGVVTEGTYDIHGLDDDPSETVEDESVESRYETDDVSA